MAISPIYQTSSYSVGVSNVSAIAPVSSSTALCDQAPTDLQIAMLLEELNYYITASNHGDAYDVQIANILSTLTALANKSDVDPDLKKLLLGTPGIMSGILNMLHVQKTLYRHYDPVKGSGLYSWQTLWQSGDVVNGITYVDSPERLIESGLSRWGQEQSIPNDDAMFLVIMISSLLPGSKAESFFGYWPDGDFEASCTKYADFAAYYVWSHQGSDFKNSDLSTFISICDKGETGSPSTKRFFAGFDNYLNDANFNQSTWPSKWKSINIIENNAAQDLIYFFNHQS